MIIAETSFAEATKEFKKFLAENNQPTEILWVFVEDTFSRKTESYETHFWLKLPLPEENEKLAEKLYRIGQQRKLGLGFSAFALCEGKVCCAIIIPEDKEDSEYMLMSPEHLKFSYVIDMSVAQAVTSSFRWKLFRLLRFKYKRGNFLVYLQSKKNLQFSSVWLIIDKIFVFKWLIVQSNTSGSSSNRITRRRGRPPASWRRG